MGRMRARRAAMEVKGLASQWACTAYSSRASRWACALEDSLHASRSACASDGARTLPVQLRSSNCPHGTSYSIKTKTRGVTWMVNRILDLLEFKNQSSRCFTGNQRCPGVWNSFPFLAWDLSMQPRTHIWFFNKFICTGACACCSNLNCAHKMLGKPS